MNRAENLVRGQCEPSGLNRGRTDAQNELIGRKVGGGERRTYQKQDVKRTGVKCSQKGNGSENKSPQTGS